MPPLKVPEMMPAYQVHEILRGMEKRGEIPHDWETTWPWLKQTQIAHATRGAQELEAWGGRAQEWPQLGEEYGGPLAGGAKEWILREPGQEAPTPLRTLGQVTGWVGTPEGLRIGTTPMKALKRSRLAVQEYGLPIDRPAATSWLRPPGGRPERAAVVQTAFMHGLPAGAGAVSPAFPEIAQPYTKQIPITPRSQITAVARPGAYATRGGALELLRTTQGRTTQAVKDWERLQLTGQPKIVPYSSPTRPEITEAYEFPMTRYTPAQAGTVSMKAFGVKAFMGPGYDPEAMLPGEGVEQILPWPKDIRQQYAGLLGTPYGRAWTEQHLGQPIPKGGVEWGTQLDPQLMAAGEAFIKEHTQMRTVPLTVSEELLGTREGGAWAEKTGPYWEQMARDPLGKQIEPKAIGGGRYQIQQQVPVLTAPFMSQYRREHVGRPFVSMPELGQLSLGRPKLAQRLWQEGAGARQPYTEMFRSIAATRGRQVTGQRVEDMPWGRIQERGRAMMEEELDWVPQGQRVPGQYLARAAAEVAPGPMRAQFGGRELQLPGAETFARLGAPGPLGEEVVPMMSAWHRLAERAAMGEGPGGLKTGQPGEMRAATRQLWLRMKEFAGGAGVQREAIGTRPESAWEGPILAHTGLRPGEEVWGDIALRKAAGAKTEEEFAALKEQIAAGGGRGISTTSWRRPISDWEGQVGGQGARIMTEEMARESGMAVSGLGRGIMTSPFTLFEQRGDVDADRLLSIIEEKTKWLQGKPVLGRLQPGIERGIGKIRRIAGALRLHAPGETPEGSPLAQMFGSTAKFNEARSWMQEVQSMGRMEDVLGAYAGVRGQTATWGQLAKSVQAGLSSKEMMNRTYNRLIRELRPGMTQTPAGRRAFRGIAAGPYQSTIDVTALSGGSRKYLEMQESLGMMPKGGGYGFARSFSPYEKDPKTGEMRPEMSKMRGWGDIGVQLTGAIMGMEEIPAAARAYGIGGEKFHRKVLQAMHAGKQPGEVLGLMGGTEREAMAAAGPMMQATLRRLYSKMPMGTQTYVDWQGQEQTVEMPTEMTGQPGAIRAAGERVRTTLKVLSRRGFRKVEGREGKLSFTPRQFEAALTGGMEVTPEQQEVLGWAKREMGYGVQPTPAAAQRPTGALSYEEQVAADAPTVKAMNDQWAQTIRRKMAALAPEGAGAPTGQLQMPQERASLAQQALARTGGMKGLKAEVGRIQQWRAEQPGLAPERGTRAAVNWMMQQGGGPAEMQEWAGIAQQAGIGFGPGEQGAWYHDYGPRVAPGGGGGRQGGGPPTTTAAPPPEGRGEPGEWGGGMGWRMQQRITRGPGGASFQQWAEPMYARGRDVEALKGVEAGMGRSLPEVRAAAKGVVEEFGKLQETLKEGRTLRKEEIDQQKEKLQTFKEARRVAQEWERQAKPTYPLTGGEEFGRLRAGVQGRLDPLMQQVEQAQGLVPEIGMRMGGMGGEPPAPGGLRGLLGGMGAGLRGAPRRALGGWGMMYLNRMRSMFVRPVQQAMQEYAQQQLTTQQALYAGGMGGGMQGAPAGILAGRAGMAQFRQGVGEAGWQTWGGLAGRAGGEAGPLGPAAAIGLPALGVGLGAAYLAGGPVGLVAGGLTAAAGAIGYGTSAMQDREAMALAQARGQQIQPGLNQEYFSFLSQNWRGIVGQGLGSLTGRVTPGMMPGLEQYGQQIQAGNLAGLPPQGQMAALQNFAQQGLGPQLPTLDPSQRMQLTGAYMGMTGQQDIGQFNQQLMVAAGQRAQMLGVPMGQAFQPWQQMARAMGFGPGEGAAERLAEGAFPQRRRRIGGLFEEGPEMGAAPEPMSERERQKQLFEQEQIAPFMNLMRNRYGMDVTEEALAPLMGRGREIERYQFGQLLQGNRYVASQLGRQIGRPDIVTMEEGGLPMYTQEMWGMQDTMTQQQRGYRDWRSQQQWGQMQATQQYTRAQWGIQDQMRALQGGQADWQYGMQQRQFGMAGQQWQERFDVGGRQWQESFQLGRDIFEARVGWQQQDLGQRRERAETQYGWQMQDWSYSENVSQLQAGWRQEDLTQEIRYATGRKKKQLMQTQERSTIMESMRRQHHEEQRERIEERKEWSDEDFEKAKERNEQLVELQRSRFEMQLRHHEESREMSQRHHDETRRLQEERMEKAREFYLKNRELEERRIKLQREHWEQQQKWAEAAWKKAREYNKEMDRLQDSYRDLGRDQQRLVARWQEMVSLGRDFADIIEAALGAQTAAPSTPSPRSPLGRIGTGSGLQSGGFIERTAERVVHEGEYVVPSEGKLVVRGDNPESLKRFDRMVGFLEIIAEATKNGQTIIVQTNDAERAREHVLSLGDQAWGLMPS